MQKVLFLMSIILPGILTFLHFTYSEWGAFAFSLVDNDETNNADLQFDRLMELLHGDFIAFASDDEPVTVPNVNMFAPPEGNRNYFIIGVESAPTQECIDFILSYTGIPRGRAYIGEAYFVKEYEMVCLRDIH